MRKRESTLKKEKKDSKKSKRTMLTLILKRVSIIRREKKVMREKIEEVAEVDIKAVEEVDMVVIEDSMMIERVVQVEDTREREKRWSLKLMTMKRVRVQRINNSTNNSSRKVRRGVKDRTRRKT